MLFNSSDRGFCGRRDVIMVTEERILKLRAAYEEFGGQTKDTDKIANSLNEQGITTARGRKWTSATVWQQLVKHCPDLVEGRLREEGKKASPKEVKPPRKEKANEEKPKETSSERSELIPLPKARPIFKEGPRGKQGSFRIQQEMYERVLKKLKKDRVRTGGKVSSLVEVLLWMYIGAPEDLLEENPYA